MYCENCGSKLKENSKFCGNCGAKVTDQTGKDEKAASEDVENFEDKFNLISETKNFEDNLSCDPEILSIIKTNEFDLSVESRILEEDTYAFLVNINTKEKNYQLYQSDGKQIALILGRYIFEFKDNKIHSSLHDKFDSNANFQLYVVHNEDVIYNIADEKKVSVNVNQNKEKASISNNIGSTESSNADSLFFEWSMEGGQIDEESIEDPSILKALEKAKALIANGEHDKALQSLPKIHFEFSGQNLDSDPSEFFTEDLEFSFEIDPNNKKNKISLELDNDDLCINISVVFALPLKKGVDASEINTWLDENGGYSAGFASGGWGYSGDKGGALLCVN
jgi:hypothetical protein